MHVCICVHVCGHTCTGKCLCSCVCMRVEARGWCQGSSWSLVHLIIFEAASLTEWTHTPLTQLISPANLIQDFLFPPVSEAGSPDRLPHSPSVSMGSGDLNSGPLACMTSGLNTKPYPHLWSVTFWRAGQDKTREQALQQMLQERLDNHKPDNGVRSLPHTIRKGTSEHVKCTCEHAHGKWGCLSM